MTWSNNNNLVASNVTKTLANNTTTAIENLTVASNTSVAVQIRYAIEVYDGTNLQIEEGEVSAHANNKAGTVAQNVCSKFGNQQGLGSGTLTVTWTITAANPAVLSVNANSSLTPSTGYPRLTYAMWNATAQATASQ